jgi:putative tryptophan/tyrosine transport system substrate-binding protein
MRRREFITLLGGTAATWPFAVRAQQNNHRIGVIIGYAESDPETRARLEAFRRGLAKRGWSEDHNIHIDYRFAAGDAAQISALALEMIALKPEVILAHTTPVAATLQKSTHDIPIVFVNVSDPIGSGFVKSLARPGANLTGLLHYEPGIVGKWLAMIKEVAPNATRVCLLGNPETTPFNYFLRAAQNATRSLALEVVPCQTASSTADVEQVLNSFGATTNGGLVVLPDSTTVSHRDLIVALAAKHRLPAVYPFGLFVGAGGLMSYGTDQVDMFRLAAYYVDRILRGDKPADLPVQAPTKFETAINAKAARAMGLTVPAGLLVAADELIE